MEKRTTKVTKKATLKKESKKSSSGMWLSPSQWGVWGKCALSCQSMQSTLKVESDDYAQDGTDLHAVIADQLNEPCEQKMNALRDEDAAIARFAIETTMSLVYASMYVLIHVEKSMKVKFGSITIGGTADTLIDDGNTIIVIDHKTGWKEVEAEGNEQLKIYAHLAAKENKNFKKWRGVIINARFNSTSYTSGDIEPEYLKSIAEDVRKGFAKKQVLTGYHCAYCNRLTTCKSIRQAVIKWMIPGAIDGLTREPDKLSEALRLAKPAEKLFDTIKKEAQLYMDLGGIIPGVSIEYTSGNRVFPNDLTGATIAEKIGLNLSQIFEHKLITPTEALRRGADKMAVNAIVIRPPRKGLKFN